MHSEIPFHIRKETRKLNLGCGRNLMPAEQGWDNFDRAPLPGVNLLGDLESPKEAFASIPDNTYGMLLMSHVLEHINQPLPLLEELHRITDPRGKLYIRVPYGSSAIAFEDPTHVRQYFLNSFMYFSQPAYARADYGYRGDWKVCERVLILAEDLDRSILPEEPEDRLQFVKTFWNVVEEFVVILQPVKPIRPVTAPGDKSPIRICFRADMQGA